MSTLKEQRMMAARKLGRHDYTDGLSLLVPKLYNREEQSAYIAGYEGEKKRDIDDALNNWNYVGSKHHY